MSNIWFTSDLHLGHANMAKVRGFSNVNEHDGLMIENFATMVSGKKDKLFVLGDVAWSAVGFQLLGALPRNMELIIGNHDAYSTKKYLEYFTNVRGFRKYKDFWLSHCPIHPQEMFRVRGNIHGHIHKSGVTGNLGRPYYNVNVEFHDYKPVHFDQIKEAFV